LPPANRVVVARTVGASAPRFAIVAVTLPLSIRVETTVRAGRRGCAKATIDTKTPRKHTTTLFISRSSLLGDSRGVVTKGRETFHPFERVIDDSTEPIRP
jgi:hypothetical protein